MIRKYSALLFVLLAIVAWPLAACQPHAQYPPTASDDTQIGTEDLKQNSAFSNFLTDYKAQNNIVSLSVIVRKDGEIVHEEYLGYRDDEFDYPTHADTSYYIASVTKPIAGTALFLASEDGEFPLDRPVTDAEHWNTSFCKWFTDSDIIFAGAELDGLTIEPFDCAGLTFRHVINMQVNGTPGEAFLYNPVVYSNLSRAYENLTGDLFEDLLRKRIFDPADMNDVASGWRDKVNGHVLSELAPPFHNVDGRYVKQVLPDDDIRASAGLYMSARELAKFDAALDNGLIISPAMKDIMWSPPLKANGIPSVYSNGWFVQNWNGRKLVWHSGWQPEAYSAIYLKVPDEDITLIALANTEGLHWSNPLNEARIDQSEFVQAFFVNFLDEN